jgi:glycerophosphoryl diester phosphodiesterase
MPAFAAAVAAGYGIELDVHLTRDHRLAVIHDANALRSTGRDLMIADCVSEEVCELRLLGTAHCIPLLDDVFNLVRGTVPILLEVKPGSPAAILGPIVHASIRDYSGPVAVQSFDPQLVLWLRRHAPDVVRGQVSGFPVEERLTYSRRLIHQSMIMNAFARPHFIAYEVGAMPNFAVWAWRRLLRAPLLLWTVKSTNDKSNVRKHRANMIFELQEAGVLAQS